MSPISRPTIIQARRMQEGGRASAVLLGVALVLAIAGCSTTDRTDASAVETVTPPSPTVTVFAAASLTDVFGQLEQEFEAANPGVDVVISYGGSSALAEQLVQGAPAEVFAAASPKTMATVVDAGIASNPTVFATNTLQIAVPAGNPAGITGLADFDRDDLLIALCAVEVPCGAVAQAAFGAAGIAAAPDTLEQDVRAVLTKVVLGEVDAGLVYRTDVLAAGDDVEGVDIVSGTSGDADAAILTAATTSYPIVALQTASATAREFLSFVLSDVGVRILAKAGFGSL
ncbi:MAG: molybdate ABC transporter substrate-binding protein [Microbacteriaceae bacterium]